MTIPLCAKSNDVIEPLLKPQWWVAQKPQADAAIKAVKDGKITITPKTSENEFSNGSQTFRIGVSLDSFGGVTDALFTLSSLRTALSKILLTTSGGSLVATSRKLKSVLLKSLLVKNTPLNRTRMFWIPGSLLVSGLFPLSAGQIPLMTSRSTTP